MALEQDLCNTVERVWGDFESSAVFSGAFIIIAFD